MNQAYKVKLDTFEGPLDLLLHLINRYEIDIYDIPVAQITEQYMNYIHTMQRLELNIASEYLVMAATLIEIKSQMLLPKPEITDDTEEYIEDPREELMQRLIEYRKYKHAAEQLKEKEVDSSQIFTRAPVAFDKKEFEKVPVVQQGDISIYDMLGALGKMFERKKWNAPLETSVQRTGVPIEQRMEEILDLVRASSEGVYFDDMFTQKTRSHIVVTFIAILELMKTKEVSCKQANHFDSLYVYYMGD
ncbi:condensin subunit ScpA [Oceanobacillus limi]|uniref:Segregation and condensation protein A n=1 Tax=Oceanobacillus limi TaxID=930131 RepID=A0A1H9ZIZ3_9BACI|nr:segregation/condensation protein A [Oceanobacillus limi]SES81555.1 condensin subunit ScpA [Oceanobacillus limi]